MARSPYPASQNVLVNSVAGTLLAVFACVIRKLLWESLPQQLLREHDVYAGMAQSDEVRKQLENL